MKIGDDNKDYNLNKLKSVKISKEELLNSIKDKSQKEKIGAIFDNFDISGNGIISNEKEDELTKLFTQIKNLDGNKNISNSIMDGTLKDNEISYFAKDVKFNNELIDLDTKKAFLKGVLDLATTKLEKQQPKTFGYKVPQNKRLYELATEIYNAQNPNGPAPTQEQKRAIVKNIINSNPEHIGYSTKRKAYFLREGRTIQIPVDLSAGAATQNSTAIPTPPQNAAKTEKTATSQTSKKTSGANTATSNKTNPPASSSSTSTVAKTNPAKTSPAKTNPNNSDIITSESGKNEAIAQFRMIYPNLDFTNLQIKETVSTNSYGKSSTKVLVDNTGKTVAKISVQKLDNYKENCIITSFNKDDKPTVEIIKDDSGHDVRKRTYEYLNDGTIKTASFDYLNHTVEKYSINPTKGELGDIETLTNVIFNSKNEPADYSYKITESNKNGQKTWVAQSSDNKKQIHKIFDTKGNLIGARIVDNLKKQEILTEYYPNIKSNWKPTNYIPQNQKPSFVPELKNSSDIIIPDILGDSSFIIADRSRVPARTTIFDIASNTATVQKIIQYDTAGREISA